MQLGLLKKDEDYDVSELKESDLDDMVASYERSKVSALKQAKTNHAYRERMVSLAKEANARGYLDFYG